MPHLILLGGGVNDQGHSPIGGSAVLIQDGDEAVLVDAGIRFGDGVEDAGELAVSKLEYKEFKGGYRIAQLPPSSLDNIPSPLDNDVLPELKRIPPDIKRLYVVVTHGHYDHSGSLPLVARVFPQAEIFMTAPTLDISSWVWEDYLKNRRDRPIFISKDVRQAKERIQLVEFNQRICRGSIEITLIPAGHILGAASVLVKMSNGEKTVFVSSDLSFENQRTVSGAPFLRSNHVGDVDYLVLESTYAGRKPLLRCKEEERLVADIERTLLGGGKALLPALASERAQELFKVLDAHGIVSRWPVYVDGSARTIADIYVRHGALPERVRDHFVVDGEREKILNSKDPLVMIAPAGMMEGGWAKAYGAEWGYDERNLIAFSCYQVRGTAGYKLTTTRGIRSLETGKGVVRTSCQVGVYQFSAHASQPDLIAMHQRLSPRVTLLVHGSEEGMRKMMQTQEAMEVGRVGEVYTL